MKKIIVIASLFLAFSFNASAQEASKVKSVKSVPTEAITTESISKDVAELTKVVTMDDSLKKDMMTLLYMRMDAMNGAKTEADKKVIYEMYGKKLMGGFTPQQMEQFKTNMNLVTKLTKY